MANPGGSKAERIYKNGFERGERWAADQAKDDELVRLSSLQAELGEKWTEFFAARSLSAFPVYQRIASLVAGRTLSERPQVEEVWQRLIPEWEPHLTSAGFARGFCEGAFKVLGERQGGH
jgi:hypothetical protein